jgi:hypothetical protein
MAIGLFSISITFSPLTMAIKPVRNSLRVVSLLPSAAEIICLVAPHEVLVGRSHEGNRHLEN